MEVSFTLPTQEIIGYGLAVMMFLAWAYALGVSYSAKAQVSRLLARIDLHSDVLEEHARHIADLSKPKKPARKKTVAKKAPKKAVQPAPREQPAGMGSALSDRLGSVMRESSLDIHDVVPAEDM
jgi:hypothetical protein